MFDLTSEEVGVEYFRDMVRLCTTFMMLDFRREIFFFKHAMAHGQFATWTQYIRLKLSYKESQYDLLVNIMEPL